MANKQVQIDLLFNANTSQAVNNINQLNSLLTKISQNTTIGINEGSMQKAIQSARDLQKHLQKAVDVDTGKLDLSKLNSSLKQSGQTLQSLTTNLQNAGPIGQQAFLKVANAISQAKAPLFQMNGALKSFTTTLLNTTKWQVASTAIHSLSGAMSSAVSHAKNLNRALNDIQIVTGYNETTMARFAEQASKSAKDLNTTVTEYSKASLIFYQQGLKGEEAAKRADTVIKLAQVTGQSAQQVSDQMTAIWNNFSEGGVELEYYADVLTKLGAATAASTDEISDGLQKFSAVAKTVGLEYETAAAAVATVVDKTRQSADVVGTSFKTIFARLESLKLGESLEDGVDLNKYTEALESVGVSVLNTDGQLRNMEDILDELGSKWDSFGRTTQIALAQTVGGIRQYNQMISLMDNWTDVEKNIELAKNAGGELQNQADIWGQSYEAAAQRVEQAKHDLYQSFLDDDSLIDITNTFGDIIKTVNKVIDSIGGIGPLLASLAGMFSSVLLPIMISGFGKITNFIKVQTGGALRETIDLQRQMSVEMGKELVKTNDNSAYQQQVSLNKQLLDEKIKLSVASKNVSEAEKKEMQARLDNYEALNLEAQETLARKIALEEEMQIAEKRLNRQTDTKKSMATFGVVNEYRQTETKKGVSQENIDSIVNEATSTSQKNNAAELEKIIASKEKINTLNGQISESEANIARLTERYNASHSGNKDARKAILESLNKEKMHAAELYDELSKVDNLNEEEKRNLDERQARLEKILEIQQNITNASRQNIKDINIGSMDAGDVLDFDTDTDTGMIAKEQTENILTQDFGMADGAASIDVSLGSFEKLYSTIQNLTTAGHEMEAVYKDIDLGLTDIQNAEKAYKKLQSSESKGIKSKKQLATANNNLKKAQDNARKSVLSSENAIMDLAKKTKQPTTEIQKLKTAFDGLKTGKNVESNLNTISTSLKTMKSATDSTLISLDSMSQGMIEMLTSSGLSSQQIEQIISSLERMGLISEDVANKIRQVVNAQNQLSQAPSVAASLMTITQSLTSMAGSAMSAFSGMNMLFSAFDEGKTPMETMMALFSGLMMVLPVITKMYGGIADAIQNKRIKQEAATKATEADTIAENINTGAELGGAAADIAGAAASEIAEEQQKDETKATGKDTAVTWANTAAKVANWVAKNPVAGAAVAAAVVIAAAGMAAYTKSIEEDTAALQENSEEKIKNAETSREAEKTNRENLKTYNQLLDTYQKTGEGKEELDKAAQKLADAYDLEGAALARLTGNYADYKKVADDAYKEHQKELANRLNDERDALRANSEKLLSTARESDLDNNGSKLDGTDYLLTLDGYGSDDEKAADYLKDNISKKFLGSTGDDTDAHFKIEGITEDPSQLIELYDELNEAYKEMSKDEKMAHSGVYDDLRTYLNDIRDDVETAKENLKEVQELEIMLGEVPGLENAGQDLQDVETLEDYTKWINKVTEALKKEHKEQDEINEIIDTFVNTTTNAAIDQLNYYHEALTEIKKEQGFGDNFNEYFNTLSEEDKKLFLTIGFDTYKTEAEWNKQLEFLKSEAEIADLKVKIDTVIATKELVKETGMTENDWIKVKDAGIEWGKDGIIEFNRFLSLSYELQIQYLDSLEKSYSLSRKERLQNQITEQKILLKNLKKDLVNATDSSTINKLQKEIDKLQEQISSNETTLNIIQVEEIAEIEKINNLLTEISELSYGEFITKEQYLLLVQYNSELAKYFQLTSQGAKIIGDPLDFQQSIKDTQMQEYTNNITTNLNEVKTQENIKNVNKRYANQNPVNQVTVDENGFIDIEEYKRQYFLLNGTEISDDQIGFSNSSVQDAYDAKRLEMEGANEDSSKEQEELKLKYGQILQDAWIYSEYQAGNTVDIGTQFGKEMSNDLHWIDKGDTEAATTSKEQWETTYDQYIQILKETEGKSNEELGFDRQALNDYTYNIGAYLKDNSELKGSEDIKIEGITDAQLNSVEGAAAYIQNQTDNVKKYTDEEIEAAATKARDDEIARIDALASTLASGVNDGIENYNEASAALSAAFEEIVENFNGKFNLAESAKEREDILLEGQDILQSSPEALEELNTAYSQSAQSAINQEKFEDINIEEVEEYSKHLMNISQESDLLDNSLKNNAEAAEEVALYTMKMNKGVEKLSSNFKNWNSVLKTSDKSSQEYCEAMIDIKDAMSDVLGVEEEFLTDSFITENLSLIEEAAEGSAEAIDKLAIKAGESILFNIAADDTQLKEKLSNLQSEMLDLIPDDIRVGATLDSEGFISEANELINAAGMTVEEAQAYFNSLGYEPEFVTEEKEIEQRNPITITETADAGTRVEELEDGSKITWLKQRTNTYTDGYTTSKGKVDVIALGPDGKTPQIKSLTKKSSGSMNNSSSKNPGGGGDKGGGSKSKSAKKNKTDVVNRYKEVNDKLEKTNRLMQKNSTLAEGMWGKDKIAKMKENVALMKTENDLLEEKLDLANEYLSEDRAALEATGAGFTFDENGTITNYTDIMTGLWSDYENTRKSYGGDDTELTEDQQKVLDDMSERIETIKSAYELYETTLDEVQDLEQEQLEKQLEIQQQNFDILNETLESNIAFEENQLAYIEHQLGRIADDFYQMAEGLALMIGSFDKNGNWDSSKSQYGMYVSRGKDYEKQKEELDKQYKNGDINKQQYLEGLEDLSSRVMENENAMRELDNTMMHYYGDTLAAAGERLGRFTALQEHHTSVLDHYTSALELMGKAADPSNMTEIIKAQKTVAENSLDTSKAWYDSMKAQADARKAEYDAAVKSGADADTLKWYEEQWLSAQEVANEAEEQMLSDYEAWLEAVKAETQNAIDIQNKEWEKSLIAGMFGENNKFSSFEDVNLALDRQKSLQEDILTTTNKKYETDKLIRQVQQDIDKSTNSVAKKELKAFIERTQAKQDQTELSETELGILQKEYELLQAKIALEEAQNAKSIVRLQRDSEGNFGYVYTADENKIADAEQNYADKENELYNARLDAANDYSEKYIQAQMEMHQTLSDLHQQYLDGEFESEEAYNNAVAAAKEYYYELLEQYQDIYHNIFADNSTWINDFMSGESDSLHSTVTTNATLMAESIIGQSGLATEQWSKNFDTQDTRTQAWKNTTEGYISNVSTAFGTMQTTINGKATLLGIDLDNIKTKTGDIVTENNKLTTSIGNESSGLIKGLNDEVVAVQKVTGQYALMRGEVDKNITAQKNLLAAINASASAIYEQDAPSNDDTSGSDNSDSSDNSNNGNSGSGSGGSGGGTKWFGNATWERGMEVYELIHTYGALGNGIQTRIVEGAKRGYNQDEVLLGQSIIDNVYPIDKNGQGMAWEDAKKRLGFDTGGYTGEWDGGYGKLAFLHQKELILNQGDTENFLASMELLDSIIKTIDLYSANAQWGGLLSTPTFGNYGSETLEQNVHIEASFPGVTDKNQIEEAFNDIINLASQYANRKY